MEPMKDNYLVHAANALSGALRYVGPGAYNYDPRSVSLFLATACHTLKIMLQDHETLQGLAKATSENQVKLRNQSGVFFEKFVEADKKLMVKAGMNRQMADYLFEDLRQIRSDLALVKPMSLDEARDGLEKLQHSACSESTRLDPKMTTIQGSILAIGGGAIWVVNAAADVSGLSGIASAASQGGGGWLFFKGIKGIKGQRKPR